MVWRGFAINRVLGCSVQQEEEEDAEYDDGDDDDEIVNAWGRRGL